VRYYRFATPEEVEESLADPDDPRFSLLWRDLDTADILIEMDGYFL
jgi:hypothetical protein